MRAVKPPPTAEEGDLVSDLQSAEDFLRESAMEEKTPEEDVPTNDEDEQTDEDMPDMVARTVDRSLHQTAGLGIPVQLSAAVCPRPLLAIEDCPHAALALAGVGGSRPSTTHDDEAVFELVEFELELKFVLKFKFEFKLRLGLHLRLTCS